LKLFLFKIKKKDRMELKLCLKLSIEAYLEIQMPNYLVKEKLIRMEIY
jgi:hypothetical protein